MTDQSGFAALDATILDALRHCFEQHHFADKEQTVKDAARAVREALLKEGETWWRNADTDRDFLYSFDTDGSQRVLVIPLGGRDQPHTTP